MDWTTVLAGIKPEENDQFDVLKGTYNCLINKIEYGLKRDSQDSQYTGEFQVVEVLEGNGTAGRKLWKRYQETPEGIKQLVDDLFTGGITVDQAHDKEGFDASVEAAKSKTVYVRAWGWTPDKNRDGSELPEAERRTFQQMAVVSEKKVKKLAEKAGAVPF